MDEDTRSEWLWKLVVWSVISLPILVLGLAFSLSLGVADQGPLGPLVWDTGFDPARDHDVHLWSPAFSNTVAVKPGEEGLTFIFGRPDMIGAFTRTGAGVPLTSEIDGAQVGGPPGAMFGLVFDYLSERDYSAVMVNNNGYVMAYRQSGTQREEWVPLQQWPHVLRGQHTNRLRVDIHDGFADIRVNDEVLKSVPSNGQGALGVIASSRAPGQVVRFGRSKCWSGGQQNPRASGDSM